LIRVKRKSDQDKKVSKPADKRLVRDGRLLVYAGKVSASEDLTRAVEEEREARAREILDVIR